MTNLDAEKIQLVLVAGVSGAGKTTVASAAEENGYYVVEDMPIKLFPGLLNLFKSERTQYAKAAVFYSLDLISEAIRLAKADPTFNVVAVGLDCSLNVLLSRFKLTRHIHPLQPKGYSLLEALSLEEGLMRAAREFFDVYIDTTTLTEKELRHQITIYLTGNEKIALHIMFSSFGFKYGIPQDAEVVFDTRVLANPYWVESLKEKTGRDPDVVAYIENDPKTAPFLDMLYHSLEVFFRLCDKEERHYVTIACGCSGGQHRSVFTAEMLAHHFEKEYNCTIFHREISRYKADEKD